MTFKRFGFSGGEWHRNDYVGELGELTWDDTNGLRLHDGSTASGNPIGSGGSTNYSDSNVAAYLPTYTGAITANGLVTTGNVEAAAVNSNLFAGTSSNVEIVADTYVWTFDTNGNISGVSANTTITTDTHTWTFGNNGVITMPDGVSTINGTQGVSINTVGEGIGIIQDGLHGIEINSDGVRIYHNNVYIEFSNIGLKFPDDSLQSTAYTGVTAQNFIDGSDYTLVLTDRNKHIYMASANTVFMPSNAQVAFPIGTTITLVSNANSINLGIEPSVANNVINIWASGGTQSFPVGSQGGGAPVFDAIIIPAHSMITLLKTLENQWVCTGIGLSEMYC